MMDSAVCEVNVPIATNAKGPPKSPNAATVRTSVLACALIFVTRSVLHTESNKQQNAGCEVQYVL